MRLRDLIQEAISPDELGRITGMTLAQAKDLATGIVDREVRDADSRARFKHRIRRALGNQEIMDLLIDMWAEQQGMGFTKTVMTRRGPGYPRG